MACIAINMGTVTQVSHAYCETGQSYINTNIQHDMQMLVRMTATLCSMSMQLRQHIDW